MGTKGFVNVILPMVFLFISFDIFSGASINDTKTLLRNLLEGYDKNVRPVENQSVAINVNTSLYIFSIQDLDEIRGIFSVMGILSMIWHDANMIWDPKHYGGVEYVLTSYKDVWVPELILINPAEDTDTFGKRWQRVYFDHTGSASWWPGDLIKSTCTLDVSNFPFDSQECIMAFIVWGYVEGQIKLISASSQIILSYYTKSPSWKLSVSKTSVTDNDTTIQFHAFLERKSGFVIVNIVLPLTCLSLLNALVFLLLPESGERISYCITVLLSIAVFMTIVSDTLPKSSEPVPVISYKLMFDMIFSSLITLAVILNLRIYNKNDKEKVPAWLQSMYEYLSCKRQKSLIHPSKCSVNGVKRDRKNPKDGSQQTLFNQESSAQKNARNSSDNLNVRKKSIVITDIEHIQSENFEKQMVRMVSGAEVLVTWKNISNMVDGIAFVVFIFLSVCSLMVFIFTTYKF